MGAVLPHSIKSLPRDGRRDITILSLPASPSGFACVYNEKIRTRRNRLLWRLA